MDLEKMEISWVSPKSLKANDWNPNHITSAEVEGKLDESIKRFGMFKPILVRQLESGELEIIGGEHRARRGAEAGLETVPVLNLGVIDDIRAKEIGLLDNGRYGSDDALELSELLKQIEPDFKSFLPYTDEDLAALEAAEQIDFSDLEMDSNDSEDPGLSTTISRVQTHQIMRFKVPVDDAHSVEDVMNYIIKTQNFSDQDSLTNAGDALVWLVKNSKAEG